MHPRIGIQQFLPNTAIFFFNMGYYNAVKTKVKQQLRIRYFSKIALHSVWQIVEAKSDYLTQNALKSLATGPQWELTALLRFPSWIYGGRE